MAINRTTYQILLDPRGQDMTCSGLDLRARPPVPVCTFRAEFKEGRYYLSQDVRDGEPEKYGSVEGKELARANLIRLTEQQVLQIIATNPRRR